MNIGEVIGEYLRRLRRRDHYFMKYLLKVLQKAYIWALRKWLN